MPRKHDDAGSISLAEMGEHVGELRRIHREAITSDDDTPELSFADIRARCHAILGMLDRAEAAEDAEPDDTAGDPINPKTGSSTGEDRKLGHDSMPFGEAFAGETKGERMLKAAEAFGYVRPERAIAGLLDSSHIKSPELKSRKLKK